MASYHERQAKLEAAIAWWKDAVDGFLTGGGPEPELVSGGGTASY